MLEILLLSFIFLQRTNLDVQKSNWNPIYLCHILYEKIKVGCV